MNLREHLKSHAEEMRDLAKMLGREPDVIKPGLWRIITGDAGSGKVAEANAYAAMLEDEGFVKNRGAAVLDFNIDPVASDVEEAFERAKDGVLIIQDPDKAMFEKSILIEELTKAHAASNTAVILTGTKKEMDDFAGLLPRSIDIVSSGVNETFDDPPGTHADALKRRLELQEQKEDILKWKATDKDKVDVSITRAVKPLRTVRFNKPETLK